MKICLGIGIVCFVITVAMFAGCVEKGDAPVAMPTSTSVETTTDRGTSRGKKLDGNA
jgi:hypothetical protein